MDFHDIFDACLLGGTMFVNYQVGKQNGYNQALNDCRNNEIEQLKKQIEELKRQQQQTKPF